MAENNQKNNSKEAGLRGISVTVLAKYGIILMFLMVAAIVVLIVELLATNARIIEKTEHYSLCNEAVISIQEASSYLTEESREYVLTEDTTHIENYFYEVEQLKRREKGAEVLNEYNIDLTNAAYNNAIDLSKKLEQMEIHAMKLVLVAEGRENQVGLPDPIKEYELSDYELGLSPDKQKEKASYIIYSTVYRTMQNQISSALESFRTDMMQVLTNELNQSSNLHTMLINLLIVAIIIMFSVIFFSMIIIHEAMIKPLTISNECISKNIRIPLRGCVELKQLAVTYNKMYEKNILNSSDRRYSGKRDRTTGAINQVGFSERLYDITHESIVSALVLYEVDDFEEYKKYHSKESISVLMIEIYNNLCNIVEQRDQIYKIDEGIFAVIYPDMTSADRQNLQIMFDKFQDRASKLSALQEVTISAGVSTTDVAGFGNGLFNNANVALYRAKDKGGGRLGFYEM